eukprot:TRINITY_DN25813_c0_g1_i1.p2 TRINITY_DN25813_c0_g1~~TRINITY_DN25813_c0_g1_i1.p2  ORF type:complete len:146 (-),score=36.99 TRINITY_DN25813_c0_g1_i1:113-550(-)
MLRSFRVVFRPLSKTGAQFSTTTMAMNVVSAEDLKKRGLEDASSVVSELIKENPVMVFSKSYCPYCVNAKKLLNNVGAAFSVLELDNLAGGKADAIQSELKRVTGASTVPRVFIGGKSIGGYDDTSRLHKQGQLLPRLQEAGVKC